MNFCFDLMLILLTAIILKRQMKWINVIVSALIGSSIILFFFSPYAEIVNHPLVKFFVSSLMVMISFGYKRIRFFMQNLLTFYFVSFVVGGALLGTHYFFEFSFIFQDQVFLTNVSNLGDTISWLFIIIGFPIVWYFSRFQFDHLEMTKIHYENIISAKIQMMNHSVSLRGLIDSGNQLYDPITKLPVMIVEMEKMKAIIPEEIFEFLSQEDPLSKLEHVNHPMISKMRIIPYRSVGQSHQFLFAVKPDKVMIEKQNQTISVTKVLLGLSQTKLSSDESYDCIVHPKMIQSGKIGNVS